MTQALGILEFLKSLQRENMQEIKKNYGLILKGGNITLSDFTFERPFALLGNNLLVKVIGGGYSYISSSSVLRNASIGRYCSIGDNVYIGGAMHPTDWVSTSPVFQKLSHTGSKIKYYQHIRDVSQIKEIIKNNIDSLFGNE